MKKNIVENRYKNTAIFEYRFMWNNTEYMINSIPYKLVIQQTNGDVYCSLDVDSYYDCVIFVGDILFWGERIGKISGYNMASKKICFCSYITSEAETFYKEQASLYPSTFPPKSGSYDYLPEILVANDICSKLAISAITANSRILVVGDLSGRVSIFDIDTFSLTNSFCVDGAVSYVNVDENKLVIDYIEALHFDSPDSLLHYKEAVRKCFVIANQDEMIAENAAALAKHDEELEQQKQKDAELERLLGHQKIIDDELREQILELKQHIDAIELFNSKKFWKIAVSVVAAISIILNILQVLGVI